MIPIYFVIGKNEPIRAGFISCSRIVEVLNVDADDLEVLAKIYSEKVTPLLEEDGQFTVMYFHREPDNPFRERQA